MTAQTLKELVAKRVAYEERTEQVFVDSITEHERQIFSLKVLRANLGKQPKEVHDLIDEMIKGATAVIERAKAL